MTGIPDTAIKLSDETDHLKDFPQHKDYYESTGCSVLAHSEGHDILLWTSIYITRGVGGCQWPAGDLREHITELIVIPSERRDKGIYDNNFVRRGWHPSQHLKPQDLEIVRESDRVIWKVEGRRHIHQPQAWEVKGSHAGVELDLSFQQLVPMWVWGPFEQAMERDQGGYDAFALSEGTIKVGGKTYPIKNGFSICEHMAVGQSYDLVAEHMRGGWFWVNGGSGDLKMHMFHFMGRGQSLGKVMVGGKAIDYIPPMGQGSISFNTLEHWVDPRSGLYAPCKWHLTMASSQGTIDMDILGLGRGYYQLPVAQGTLMWMWILSLGNGAFYTSDGRSLPIKDMLVCAEWGRCVLIAEETLSGSMSQS